MSNEQFDSLLQSSYEEGSGEAMQAIEGLDDNLDLASVAQELSEPEDLLESQDDAPIIRLLNAMLTQAIKEMYYSGDGHEVMTKKSVNGALMLYLDFINIFQSLIYLTGNRNN